MNIVTIKVHCAMCGKFKVEHEVDINEHGYFTFPEAYCPECLAVLTCVIDKKENDGPRNTAN